MPSFDIVCTPDIQEIRNAVDQAKREAGNRYDFKGTDTEIELTGDDSSPDGVTITSSDEFYVDSAIDIVIGKLVKRSVDPKFFERQAVQQVGGGRARLLYALKSGLPQDIAKQIVKDIKGTKVKVQPAIRGDEVRVSGKKRDDLQAIIQELKQKDYDRPLMFTNFRD